MYTYKRDFYKLLAVDTCVWSVTSVCIPFLNAYYAMNGITDMQIGVLAAIGPVAGLCFQPLWAMLSDRTEKRRLVLQLISVVGGAAYLLYLLGTAFAVFCVATIVFMAFNSAIMPLNDAIVTKEAQEKKVNFAIVRMGGTVGFAIVILFVGGYLRSHPTHMFWIGFVVYAGYAAVCFLLPKDPKGKNRAGRPARAGKVQPDEKTGQKRKGKIFRSNEVVFVLAIAFIMQIAVSFHAAFVSVFVVDLGYDQSMIGILFCISAFSEVPVLFAMPKLMARFNTLGLLCAALFIAALRVILVPNGTIPYIILSQALQGPSYMIAYYGCVTYIRDHVHEGKISQGQTILVMIQGGFATVAGSLAGGFLSDAFGLAPAFVIISGFVVVSAVGILVATRVYAAKQAGRRD
ncbi:MAG: MFS transporter [Clostridiales Family XIII bacterium]|jgi:MFS family permease|nr:MFS transporter [Clostridiales Family XIII bacterium]